ncbi:MAG: hypothetical protein IJS71_09320 [Clostridia bacterium]|nr:hypothetical protein [Clostridia bacterium]
MNVKNNANIPEVKDTAVKITYFSADEMLRFKMIQKEIWELDQKCFIEDARKEGLAQGREEGFKEGFKEGFEEGFKEGFKKGFKEGRLKALVSLVKDGKITVSKASENAKMTEEEFRKLL